MKRLLLALLLLLPACAHAPVAPVKHQGLPPRIIALLHAKLDPPLLPEKFESFNNAAVFAIAQSYELTHTYESAGVIVVGPDMQFQITQPKTENSGDSVGVPSFARPGYVVVADYHTHPCLPYTHFVRWFSEEDIEVVEGDVTDPTVIAIMGDMCTGIVNEWAQGVDPVGNHLEHNYDNSPVLLTTGHVIGHIEITKEPKVLEGPSASPTGELIGE